MATHTTHTTHTIDVATDRDYTQPPSNTARRRRPSYRTQAMSTVPPSNAAASTSIDPHTALMHGHDHEGLSERTRHSHGDSVEDDERKEKKMGELITPYLARHIPPQYNPLGGGDR